jgi:flagellar motor switch protein FliN
MADEFSADGLRSASFDQLQDAQSSGATIDFNSLRYLPVTVTVELGRTRCSIGDLLALGQGSVLELDAKAGDPLRLLVNGCLIAKGEIVVVNDQFGIRLTDIYPLSQQDTLGT